MSLGPTYGVAYTFRAMFLESPSGGIVDTPTIEEGDVQVRIDGGSWVNIATLPTASGTHFDVALSSGEMSGEQVIVRFQDVSGGEWKTETIRIFTAPAPFAANFEAEYDGTGYVGGTIRRTTNVEKWWNWDDESFSIFSLYMKNGLDIFRSMVEYDSDHWKYHGNAIEKTGYALTASYDLYHATIDFVKDSTNDEYTIRWFKNGVRQTSGITSPTIQVVKRSDGTDLVASTAMTQVGSTGAYKYDEGTNRTTAGESYEVVVAATIDGSSRTFSRLVGRDS